MSSGKYLTDNEVVASLHRAQAQGFRLVAKFLEAHEMSQEEIYNFLLEVADEMEAQSVVVSIRDDIANNKL